MYSNNILNFEESTTILNACTKKSWDLLNAPCIYIYIYILLEPNHQIILCHIQDTFVSYSGDSLGESYPAAELQSVYSTAPADGADR